jgi:hypothetical protein
VAKVRDIEKMVKGHPDAGDREIRETIETVKELKRAGLVKSGYGLISPYQDRRIQGKTPRAVKP